jgi:hypothetical protein
LNLTKKALFKVYKIILSMDILLLCLLEIQLLKRIDLKFLQFQIIFKELNYKKLKLKSKSKIYLYL